MARIIYEKLVRDRIPEIIAQSGRRCDARVLEGDEYYAMLKAKLREETDEFEASGELEELADILEVVRALSRAIGSTPEDLESARAHKAESRGGFHERIFLTWAEDSKCPRRE